MAPLYRLGDQPYDHRALVRAYINTQHDRYVHEDFLNYYKALVGVMETALGVHLSREAFSDAQKLALWSLFDSTVHSHVRTGTPWDNYLETGLLVLALERAGERGAAVLTASNRIGELATASREQHLAMLYALFECLFGPVTVVLSSDELRERGFDDAREPKIEDYYDLM